MSDKADRIEAERSADEAVSPAPKRGCLARFGANVKRFWWAYLIGFIAVVLVVVLPVIYVGYPNLAQRDVNKSTLDITEMEVSNPAPDSFDIKLRQVIGSDSHYKPLFYAFNATVKLAGAEDPFFTVEVPEVKAVDGAVSTINQKVQLPESGAFTDFSVAVMEKESLDIIIQGRPQLRVGKLPKATVDYDKTVTLKGLNGLKGFKVLDIKLASDQPDGANMIGEVLIPNPSIMTLAMGNITLDLSVEGTKIGISHLNNIVIRPGDNTFAMRTIANQSHVLSLVAGKDAKFKSGKIPLDIVGNSSVYNGELIPYFTKALSSNKLSIELDVLGALGG
ncbi:hypothetical protein AJ80_02705 [Polytolypa hystricis UAMH7299]|uniref:Uncharacterized protein n=1 Tax=Polytolypa hystricis (strain UAMH7299) TaxID=1447883 RepID=A0A2B7YQH9_POLH7|nr:hypothetical protein AJ80_02705 [Polytolypa hystricis UAMH7299]